MLSKMKIHVQHKWRYRNGKRQDKVKESSNLEIHNFTILFSYTLARYLKFLCYKIQKHEK